jgi:hypothetical protein
VSFFVGVCLDFSAPSCLSRSFSSLFPLVIERDLPPVRGAALKWIAPPAFLPPLPPKTNKQKNA